MDESITIPRKRLLNYLRRDIYEQILDEKKATEKYNEMAEIAKLLGLSTEAENLERIAKQEDEHHSILISMQTGLPN